MVERLAIGALAPTFSLKGVDGRQYTLESFQSARVLVVVFSCNHCPYVQAYEDRLMALQRDFLDRGVQFVTINSNDGRQYPEDAYEEMVKRSRAKAFPFPYVHDETQEVAKAYGASHTPEIFVFRKDRRLAYTGLIDDNWRNPGQVKRLHLRETLESLLADRPIDEPETFAIGCTIKWRP